MSIRRPCAGLRACVTVHLDGSFGKDLRDFLRHIVTKALEDSV